MTCQFLALESVPISDLRPTQMTVGYRSVRRKRGRWREQSRSNALSALERHVIPIIRGPRGRPYVIDHHHSARALLEEGVGEIAITMVADLSALSGGEFWDFCGERNWCHPYDAEGVRREISAIPKAIGDLADDPFRSLADELRRAGGFAKAATPFSEFGWAEFLRGRIERAALDADFDAALHRALELAKSAEAQHLPGWRALRITEDNTL